MSSSDMEKVILNRSDQLFNSHNIEQAAFLTPAIGQHIRQTYGTPVYVYDENTLISQANKALKFPNPYGLTVRFAMKASPNKAILQLFHSMGLHFDTSSGYECERAIRAGIPASSLSLSTQEKPANLEELIKAGIKFNACSLSQLEAFGKLFPGKACGKSSFWVIQIPHIQYLMHRCEVQSW